MKILHKKYNGDKDQLEFKYNLNCTLFYFFVARYLIWLLRLPTLNEFALHEKWGGLVLIYLSYTSKSIFLIT